MEDQKGSEDVVHLRERLYHAVTTERAGHVEEHHVGFHVLSGNHPLGIVEGVHRIALDDGVGVLFDPAEMVASESPNRLGWLIDFNKADACSALACNCASSVIFI